MKITVLTPDLSGNCLGRAYILARVLQRAYDVEIVGPMFGEGIWSPLSGCDDVPLVPVKVGKLPLSYLQLMKLPGSISGDVIYASKPLLTSFGVGLLHRYRNGKPLVLDIDDWELGFIRANIRRRGLTGRIKYLAGSAVKLYDASSCWNILLCDKLVSLADGITVSNSFLERKYGGVIVPHGRDAGDYDPGRYDRLSARTRHKIGEDEQVIMFFGTPHPYKGLEELLAAVHSIDDPRVSLAVIGIGEDEPYGASFSLRASGTLGNRFKQFPPQPFEKVPEFLAMADVVVVPQTRSPATVGQTPAKVFDAMAMAKPVIATNVSDLPDILDGCGWIVESGNVRQLAGAIRSVLDDPLEAASRGKLARERFVESYGWDAMESNLTGVFATYE